MRLLLLILLITTQGLSNTKELTLLRTSFDKAVMSEKGAKLFLSTVNPSTSAIHKGYHAAVTMMMAQYAFSPFKKIDLYNRGKEQLEQCIKENPDEVELRFIRYMIQTNSPAFLKYNTSLSKDKQFIEQSLPTLLDTDLKKRMETYFQSKPKK